MRQAFNNLLCLKLLGPRRRPALFAPLVFLVLTPVLLLLLLLQLGAQVLCRVSELVRCPRGQTSSGRLAHLDHPCSLLVGLRGATGRPPSRVSGPLRDPLLLATRPFRETDSRTPMSRRWTTWVSLKPRSKHEPVLCDPRWTCSSNSSNNSNISSSKRLLCHRCWRN